MLKSKLLPTWTWKDFPLMQILRNFFWCTASWESCSILWCWPIPPFAPYILKQKKAIGDLKTVLFVIPNILMMFSAKMPNLLFMQRMIQPWKNKRMDLIVKQGCHWVEINQLEHVKRGRGTSSPFPFPPCHHPRITGTIGKTGCDLYVCFWRGVLINSHERGPSIQPASRDALQWVGLLSSPAHKNLSMEKKKGVDSPNVSRPKWCH